VKELSETEAAALAAKWPLPAFANQEDEIATAQDFVRSRSRGMACWLLGLSTANLKREWREYRAQSLDMRRFSAWCAATRTQWDAQRGKYVSLNPDAQP
jgi:hypothetical protein